MDRSKKRRQIKNIKIILVFLQKSKVYSKQLKINTFYFSILLKENFENKKFRNGNDSTSALNDN